MPRFSAGRWGAREACGAGHNLPFRRAWREFGFFWTKLRGRPVVARKRFGGGPTEARLEVWREEFVAKDCDGCCGPFSVRYRLHFERDSREEVERRKRAAREQVLQPVSAELLELDIREVYQPGSGE